MNKFRSLSPLIGIVSSGLFIGTIFGVYKLNEILNIRNVKHNYLKKVLEE